MPQNIRPHMFHNVRAGCYQQIVYTRSKIGSSMFQFQVLTRLPARFLTCYFLRLTPRAVVQWWRQRAWDVILTSSWWTFAICCGEMLPCGRVRHSCSSHLGGFPSGRPLIIADGLVFSNFSDLVFSKLCNQLVCYLASGIFCLHETVYFGTLKTCSQFRAHCCNLICAYCALVHGFIFGNCIYWCFKLWLHMRFECLLSICHRHEKKIALLYLGGGVL